MTTQVNSLRSKIMLVVLVTTFMALLVSAAAMVLYDIQTFKKLRVDELTIQADILARVTGSAIAFNDPAAAQENLATLAATPRILAAAIYTADGARFAWYRRAGSEGSILPDPPRSGGYRIDGQHIVLTQPIVENREFVGTVYLQARYDMTDRLLTYVGILSVVTIVSLALAAAIAAHLQATITRPIVAVTRVAREIMQRRDFSLRVDRTTDDEIGVLASSFNSMLDEVAKRAEELEKANRSLAQEMAVRLEAESALRLADRRKDEFLAMLAHELRNPLAPIDAAAQLMKHVQLDRARLIQTSEIITRQVRHMTSLVSDLLDVSRVTRGLVTLETQPLGLRAVVSEAVEQARPMIDARRHRLDIAEDSAFGYTNGDKKRLVQVVANILNNAAKYTPDGGEISLRASLDEHQCVLTIDDNGIGMEPALVSHVFELFTQAERSSDRSQGGLGLGLALVKSLVELHGGRVTAESKGPNLGSRFTVHLPRLTGYTEADPDAQASPAIPTAPGALTIMVVDDNRDAADALAMFLQSLGYDVIVEYSSLTALTRAGIRMPDVCLLDIGLPVLDGNELARRLRAHPVSTRPTLIAITGYDQPQDRADAIAAGFDHYFVKPMEPERLAALLEGIGLAVKAGG